MTIMETAGESTVTAPSVTLRNGVEMPLIGYGVYQIAKEDAARCVADAIEVGYRHIDTAQSYYNEKEVGDGIKASGADRADLFVTTKVWVEHYGYEETLRSVDESLRKLGTGYIDLLLLHQPFSDVYGSWRALEKLYRDGVVRAIGVSNFYPDRLADLCAFNEIAPMVDQVETNPFHQQIAAHENMTARGVVHEAWAPFGEGRNGMFVNETLAAIGAKHGKSVAQVIMRWLVQRGVVALAKSTHRERMIENLDVFDFVLTDADMAAIAGMDDDASLFFDHRTPETVDFMARLIKERAGRE